MFSLNASKPIMIDLSIGGQLTTISCGHVVVEFIKFIAYQRQQIPYNYPWLKQIVNRKKDINEQSGDVRESFQSEKHFRVASTALENLDFILKSLLQEINGCVPDEVCVALGSTPVSLKEVYRLIMPQVCHKPQCHSSLIATDQKIQRNLFRSLVTEEKLSDILFNPILPTNLYVFIKKKMVGTQESVICTDIFENTSGFRIPRTSKIVVIDFGSNEQVNCCNEIEVFGDVEKKLQSVTLKTDEEDYHEIESTDTTKWYQSSYSMKGFKDCIVNGSSITNTWLGS